MKHTKVHMNNRQNLEDFVFSEIFNNQTKTVDEIFRKARKHGFNATRDQVNETVKKVCTPYKMKN